MTSALAASLLLTAVVFAVPLLLAALGEVLGERAGVLNIGLEGMMLSGAWAGAAGSLVAGSPWAGLPAAIAAGMMLAALFAVLTLTWRADAVVVGTGLNLLALGLTGTLQRALMHRWSPPGDARSIPEWWFVAAGVALCVLLWLLLAQTGTGLRLRAVGEQPAAADAAGINVVRVRWLATLGNGALCGLAGAFLSLSHTNSFAENMTAGRGFIALAIVILGRWSPPGAVAAALLFGLADGLQFLLQLRLGTAYYPLLLALPYVLTLLTLAGFTGARRAPAALGVPYER